MTQQATEAPHISYSRFSDWVTCGKKYQLARIQRAPQASGWAAVGGTAVHEATAYIDTEDGNLNEPVGELFMRHFEDAIASEVERNANDPSAWKASGRTSKEWPNGEDRSWWEAKGPGMVAAWIRWRKANPDLKLWTTPDGDLAVELEIKVQFADDLPATLMFIDRVFVRPTSGGLLVVDIKAGSFVPQDAMQLGVYATGVELAYDMRPDAGGYWMARKPEAMSPVSLDGYGQRYLAHQQRQFLRGVEQEVFLPKPSNLCGSCSVRDSCYARGGRLSHLYDPDYPQFDSAKEVDSDG